MRTEQRSFAAKIQQDANGNSTSGGVGVWTQTGDREFTATVVEVVSNQKQGDLGTIKIRNVLKLNDTGDGFSASSKIDFLTLDGTLAFSQSGGANGKRIKVEPLG